MHRAERLADTLLEEVSEIVGYELDDPRLDRVTVTDVRVAENLRNANVYILAEGSEQEIQSALVALNHAAPFVRQQVALNMNLRYAPQLHFLRDTVEENAARVDQLLDSMEIPEENYDSGEEE
ncbi:MAG: 30S ribosome-binding factor RbfA [Pyrinomonadaceae bacterium]